MRRILTNIKSIFYLAHMLGFLWIPRYPVTFASSAVTPFIIFFLLVVVRGGGGVSLSASGALIMIAATRGLAIAPELVVNKNIHKLQDIFVSSPIPPTTYMIGLAIAELVSSAPSLLFFFLFLAYTGESFVSLALIFSVVLMTWLFASSFGFFVATYIPNLKNPYQSATLIATALTVLPPVFYSLNVVPPQLIPLALIIPTTHSAIIVQNSLGLRNGIWDATAYSWLILIAYVIVFVFLASFKAQWRER